MQRHQKLSSSVLCLDSLKGLSFHAQHRGGGWRVGQHLCVVRTAQNNSFSSRLSARHLLHKPVSSIHSSPVADEPGEQGKGDACSARQDRHQQNCCSCCYRVTVFLKNEILEHKFLFSLPLSVLTDIKTTFQPRSFQMLDSWSTGCGQNNGVLSTTRTGTKNPTQASPRSYKLTCCHQTLTFVYNQVFKLWGKVKMLFLDKKKSWAL